jgi:N-acetylneuraminate lyase
MTIPQLGLIAATHTPFSPDGRVQLDDIRLLAEHLVRNRVAGAFVAGSTGESHSLTVAERCELTEAWADAARELPLEVIVHVGHNSQADAVELARHAAQAGAGAVAAVAPNYFRPATAHDLVEFLAPIANAAPDLPFYYYHIPPITRVDVSVVELLSSGKRRMPNLRGVKYSDMNLSQMQHLIQLEGGAFDVLFGCDECLLAALALGVRGAVGSTYNFAAGLYHRVMEAFEAGDLAAAQAAQARAAEMIDVMKAYGFLPASRVVMEMLGLPIGPCRPPLGRLSESERDELVARLQELEVLDEPVSHAAFASVPA